MAIVTNFKEQGIDVGAEFASAFEKVQSNPEKFPGWYADPILATIYPDGVPGGLWSWGSNDSGQLGDGTITYRSSPIQVGSLTNWKQVASGYYHTTSIKTDGTLWSFGRNNYGQLGDGTRTHRSSPIQVGSLTNWKQVAGGGNHTTVIK